MWTDPGNQAQVRREMSDMASITRQIPDRRAQPLAKIYDN
jgi:hypothetical protein